MSETTLADIERLCWRLSGWQVDQRSVDELLKAVTAYAGYGPDQSPGVGAEGSGAAAPWPGGGVGEAERPFESLPAPDAPDDVPDPVNGLEGGVQRLHVTGTLTLVCSGTHVSVPGGAVALQLAPVVEDPEMERVCRECGEAKPLDAYSADRRGRNGRRRLCRECDNARKRDRRAEQKAAA